MGTGFWLFPVWHEVRAEHSVAGQNRAGWPPCLRNHGIVPSVLSGLGKAKRAVLARRQSRRLQLPARDVHPSDGVSGVWTLAVCGRECVDGGERKERPW